jgi:DnaJ-class molecular chaperone
MQYDEFEKALDILGILTRTSKKDLKKKYLKLSKKWHPDAQEGSHEKFQELKDAYDLVCEYMDNFQFMCDEEEFKHQNPSFMNYNNWNK